VSLSVQCVVCGPAGRDEVSLSVQCVAQRSTRKEAEKCPKALD
jgi:hypothetical protein